MGKQIIFINNYQKGNIFIFFNKKNITTLINKKLSYQQITTVKIRNNYKK